MIVKGTSLSNASRSPTDLIPGVDKPQQGTVVPAVAKAIGIIRYLNQRESMEAGLNALATDLQITKSHCHNILKTLESAGWLNYDQNRRTYSLASRMLSDISRMVARQDWPSAIHEELEKLSRQIRTPCVLTRVDSDGSYVAVDKAEPRAEFQVTVPIGHRFAPDSTAQFRVRLAWADDATREREMEKWVPVQHTPSSMMSKDAMMKEVMATRERGYDVSRAEYTPGVMTFAAPVFDAYGRVTFILIAPGFADELAQRENEVARELLLSAERINGYCNGFSSI